MKLSFGKTISLSKNLWAPASPFRQDIFRFSFITKLLILIGFLTLHSLSGFLSLKLASINSSTSPFWVPSGVALAILLLFGYRWALAVLASSLIINSTTGISWPGVVGLATANTFESILSAWIISRLHNTKLVEGFKEPLSLLFGALLGCTLGATIGVTTLHQLGLVPGSQFSYVWMTWWGGDLVGMITVAPFLILGASQIKNWKRLNFLRLAEVCAYGALILLVNVAVFRSRVPEGIYWANCLIILLVNIRIGPLAARSLLILNCLLALALSLQGDVIFEFGSTNLNLLYLQGITFCFAVTTYFIESMFKQDVPVVAFRIFAAGLIAIVCTVSLLAYEERHFKVTELKSLLDNTERSLARSEENYSNLLISSASFLNTHSKLENKTWKLFTDHLGIEEKYGAINGLGFVSRVDKRKLKEFEARIQKDSQPSFRVRMLNETYSSQFEDAYPITFLEPLAKNTLALGLDLGSEPKRREAAQRALEEVRVIATEPIQLVQDRVKRPGFLIYYPVYQHKAPKSASVHEAIGWTYAPVISEHFFDTALNTSDHFVHIKITLDEEILFSTPNADSAMNTRSPFYAKKELEIFGQQHTLTIYPKEVFFKSNSAFPLIIGIVLTLLLIVLTSLVTNMIIFNQRLRDLVDQRTKELDLERSKALHASKLASLGELSAGVAHEINNPLAIIIANVKLWTYTQNDVSRTQKRLDAILKASHRIERIVQGLRKFSRTSVQTPHQRGNLGDILNEALLMTSAKARLHSVEVKFKADRGLLIDCDALEIEQVIINIVNNAIDAAKSSRELTVQVDCFRDANTAVIQVRDSGPGVSLEVEEKLFEPFFTTKTVGEGTGLGLSISKGILDQHKATISLNRKVSSSCFEIRFPYTEEVQKAA